MIKSVVLVFFLIFYLLPLSAQVKEVTINGQSIVDQGTRLQAKFSPNSKYILYASNGGTEACYRRELVTGSYVVARTFVYDKLYSCNVAEYDHTGNFVVFTAVDALTSVPNNPPTVEFTGVWKLGDWDGNRHIVTENLKENKHKLARFNKPGNLVLLIRDDQKGRYARLWDWNGNNVQDIKTEGNILYADFNHKGDKVILVKRNNNTYLELWDAYKFAKDKILKISKPSGFLTYAISSCVGNNIVAGTDKGEIIVWDSESEKQLTVKNEHSKAIIKIVLDKTCQKFLTTSKDSTVKVWNSETLDVITTLKGHTATVTDAQFSPNGNFVITGSNDSTACIWDSRTGDRLAILANYKGAVNTTQFSVTGDTVLVSDDYGEAHMYTISGLHPSAIATEGTNGNDMDINVVCENNVLRIEFANAITNTASYTVINYMGEEVMKGNIIAGNVNFELSTQNIRSGYYILSTELDGKVNRKKFIVSQ